VTSCPELSTIPDKAIPPGGDRPLTAPRRPPGARTPDGFYGWRIVALSAVALAATAPGQTAAVSAFIDPMIGDLGISRSQISTSYLLGTLLGAAAMPTVGRTLDRHGVRRTMAVIGAAFGTVLLALSAVSGLVGLTAGFIGIRMFGQGALGLTATTATALWFTRRRGTALGLASAFGAVGISLAPVLLERLIAEHGWRTAWAVEGAIVWAVVLPVALIGMRDRPAQLGQQPDGRPRPGQEPHVDWGMTRAEAMRSAFFWVVTAGVAVSGLLSTAVAFHQISLLGEHGLSPTEAATNFLPQTAAALAATLVTGALVDRVSPRWLTSANMLVLAAALGWGAVVSPGWSAVGFGVALGAAGGSIRSLEAATFPRFYGTLHLGAIRGFAMAIGVASTAFGPLAFALVHDATGSYTPALIGATALPLAVAVAAALVHPPHTARPAGPHATAAATPPGPSLEER